MCGSGGGDGGAGEREEARRARISATKLRIENAFGHSASRISGVRKAALAFFTPKLNQQRKTGIRSLTFELARRGLFGGSANIDALGEFQRKEDEGREKVGTLGIGAVNRAKALDASLKQSLIAQADADGDAEGIVATALSQQLANAERAKGDIRTESLGDVFENSGNLFRNIGINNGIQQGRNQYLDGLNRQSTFARSSNSSNNGSITP